MMRHAAAPAAPAPPAMCTCAGVRAASAAARAAPAGRRHRGRVPAAVAAPVMADNAAVALSPEELLRRFPLPPGPALCAQNRRRLVDGHVRGGALLLEAGGLVPRNGDVYHKYRAESSFAWAVAPLAEPDFAALIDGESGHFTLLAPKPPAEAAFWTGPQPSLDALAEAHGADAAAYREDLPALLKQRHAGQVLHVLPSAVASPGLAEAAQAAGGRLDSEHLQRALHRLRALKTEAEVGALAVANAGSAAAHAALWRACKPGVHEYQLEAAFAAAALHAGLRGMGYPPIVGAGANAAILHYERNDAQVAPGDLVLVDAGAECRLYTADISRTAPASGRFAGAQRDAYEAVRAAQDAALGAMRPGALWADADRAARLALLDGLRAMGLLRAGGSAAGLEAALAAKVDRVFCPHGLSHFLGLDVHDVSDEGPTPTVLRAGHVVTVEPGFYMIDLLLDRAAGDAAQKELINWEAVGRLRGAAIGGVRIEDNVYVHAGGAVNLTSPFLPKAPAEVEAAMAGGM